MSGMLYSLVHAASFGDYYSDCRCGGLASIVLVRICQAVCIKATIKISVQSYMLVQ